MTMHVEVQQKRGLRQSQPSAIEKPSRLVHSKALRGKAVPQLPVCVANPCSNAMRTLSKAASCPALILRSIDRGTSPTWQLQFEQVQYIFHVTHLQQLGLTALEQRNSSLQQGLVHLVSHDHIHHPEFGNSNRAGNTV